MTFTDVFLIRVRVGVGVRVRIGVRVYGMTFTDVFLTCENITCKPFLKPGR